MSRTLFNHIQAITSEQDPNYFDKLTEEDEKSWSNFMINRFLSMNPDWVEMVSTILPLTKTLRTKDMYKVYINIIPKGKYYLNYIKGKKEAQYDDFIIELIKKEFLCSERQADDYLDILYSTKEGRENIKWICERYGIEKKQITKLKLKL